MRGAETAPIVSLAMVLLVGCFGSSEPAKDPAADDTPWGPALSEREKKAIAELSTPELVDMLRHGDTLHKFAAVAQLTAGDNRKKNFDLLLRVAAEGGETANIIVEGLVLGVEESAGAEDRRMVDEFLDFLAAELQKDQPAVNKYQAIRSVAQAVSRGARRTPPPGKDTRESPYGHERALRILAPCLDDKDVGIRADTVDALIVIGEESPALAGRVLATLERQLAREEARPQGKAEKDKMKGVLEGATEKMSRQLMGPDIKPAR